MSIKYFITGTGTDIGKTVITAGIADLAIQNGKKCSVIKPIQTGTETYPTDICEVRKMVPKVMDIPETDSIKYSYKLPASPHLAAAEENDKIKIHELTQYIKKREKKFNPDILLIEGAGGVLVPINENETFLDLLKELNIPVILTTLAGLGTINHTLLSISVLKSANIEIAGIIVNKMPKNPTIIEKDNIRIIEKMSGIPIIAIIGDYSSDKDFFGNIKSDFRKSEKVINLL